MTKSSSHLGLSDTADIRHTVIGLFASLMNLEAEHDSLEEDIGELHDFQLCNDETPLSNRLFHF